MCTYVKISECGFRLDYSQQSIADGIAWDNPSPSVDRLIDRLIAPATTSRPVVTAATTKKKLLSVGGVRK